MEEKIEMPIEYRHFRLLTNISCLVTFVRGSEINEENQFIDFRLITRSGKNHAFIPLRQQPQMPIEYRHFLNITTILSVKIVTSYL